LSGAFKFSNSASSGFFPTRLATNPSTCSATRLPNSCLHMVKKSVGSRVMPSECQGRTWSSLSSST